MNMAALLVLAIFLSVMGSHIIELWQVPQSRPVWQRPWRAIVAQVLAYVGLFGIFLALTQRPWLTVALTLAIATLLLLVNNAKYRHLREPFLAADFIYFWEAIRYPQLYLPYFGYARAVALLLALLGAITAWLWLEPALHGVVFAGIGFDGTLLTGIVLALVAGLTLSLTVGSPIEPGPYFEDDDPTEALRRWGLIALLMRQRARQRQTRPVLETPFLNLPKARGIGAQPAQFIATNERPNQNHKPNPLPHFVCVQAESFFDARRAFPAHVPNDWFSHWDDLRANALSSGTLAVPAWGANTVRSEFAFLTGIADDALGVHRFQPYKMLLKPVNRGAKLLSLPRWLVAQGYQSHFIHPYLPAFYARDKVIPALGFKTFIDIHSFKSHPRDAGYVTDPVLAEHVTALIAQASEPVFLHVVTMQGHGPYGSADSAPETMLSQYLDRMRHTDQMLRVLQNGFTQTERPVVLCVFGDHLPILPTVYDSLGVPSANTDYLIWRSDESPVARVYAHRRLDELAMAMLVAGGLVQAHPLADTKR